jgi:hypothetical protein
MMGRNTIIETVRTISSANSVSNTITRPDNTTAYSANDVIGTSSSANIEFANVIGFKGESFFIAGAWLMIPINAVPSGMDAFRLHLYNAEPADIADNAAYNLPLADRSKYLGYIDFEAPIDLGDTLYAQVNNINHMRKFTSDSNTIYGILETIGAYTPAAETVYTVGLEAVGA